VAKGNKLMEKNVFTINRCSDKQWDDFVKQHKLGWVTHSSKWKHALEASFSHIKGYYLTLMDGIKGCISAALPIYKVSSLLMGTRLVSVPFGTICDPLASLPGQADRLIQHAIEFADMHNCAQVEIRCLNTGEMICTETLGRTDFFVHHFIRLGAPFGRIATTISPNMRHAEDSTCRKKRARNCHGRKCGRS
jgi:hypothetical protein